MPPRARPSTQDVGEGDLHDALIECIGIGGGRSREDAAVLVVVTDRDLAMPVAAAARVAQAVGVVANVHEGSELLEERVESALGEVDHLAAGVSSEADDLVIDPQRRVRRVARLIRPGPLIRPCASIDRTLDDVARPSRDGPPDEGTGPLGELVAARDLPTLGLGEPRERRPAAQAVA